MSLNRLDPETSGKMVLDTYQSRLDALDEKDMRIIDQMTLLSDSRRKLAKQRDSMQDGMSRLMEIVDEWQDGLKEDVTDYPEWDARMKKLETAANKAMLGWRTF